MRERSELMNQESENPDIPQVPSGEAHAEEAVAKPKRRRAPAKSAADVAPEIATEAAAEESKPAPKPRVRRKKAEEVTEAAPEAPEVLIQVETKRQYVETPAPVVQAVAAPAPAPVVAPSSDDGSHLFTIGPDIEVPAYQPLFSEPEDTGTPRVRRSRTLRTLRRNRRDDPRHGPAPVRPEDGFDARGQRSNSFVAEGNVAIDDDLDEEDQERLNQAPELVLPNHETGVRSGERFADVTAGSYDDETLTSESTEKRILQPQVDAPKLQKVLAQAGISSRRDIEQMIADGRISVNGEVAHIGQRVMFRDRIDLDGQPLRVRIAPPPVRILAYHKPVGEVVTFQDPEGRPTVFRNLPRIAFSKWQSVGRLDINTEGLLLFTTSGELANQLMHPRFGVEREYAVRVLGQLDADKRNQLLTGVPIDGYESSFRSIEDGGGDGANHWYRVVIAEGRYREVRRLFDSVGLTVSRLIRIRYGSIVLPRGLKRGVWVELNEKEVQLICNQVGIDRQSGNRDGRGRKEEGRRRPSFLGGVGTGQNRNNNRRGSRDDRGPQQFSQRFDRNAPRPGQQRYNNGPSERSWDSASSSHRQDRGDGYDDHMDDPRHIPNPLEQTFDRRFASGTKKIVSGFGRPSEHSDSQDSGSSRRGGPKQPDPMQTSVGYIGADAFFRKTGPGSKRRGGGGGRGGFGR